MPIDPALDREPFCYLTTTGRISGEPRTIEIWFARHGGTLYLLSGGGDRAQWVRNLRRDARVRVRLGATEHDARARVVEDADEDALARRLLLAKYARPGRELRDWGRRALPVAVDLA